MIENPRLKKFDPIRFVVTSPPPTCIQRPVDVNQYWFTVSVLVPGT